MIGVYWYSFSNHYWDPEEEEEEEEEFIRIHRIL